MLVLGKKKVTKNIFLTFQVSKIDIFCTLSEAQQTWDLVFYNLEKIFRKNKKSLLRTRQYVTLKKFLGTYGFRWLVFLIFDFKGLIILFPRFGDSATCDFPMGIEEGNFGTCKNHSTM
jgi:hypothetical protein